jgi:hypothetical protein
VPAGFGNTCLRLVGCDHKPLRKTVSLTPLKHALFRGSVMGISAAQLNNHLVALPRDGRVCFCPQTQELTTATEPSGISDIALWPERSACDLRFVWRELSPAVAALVMAPEGRGKVVFARSVLDELSFSQNEAPVWELVQRLTAAGHAVGVLANSETASEPLLPADDGLPEIAPKWPPGNQRWLSQRLQQFQPDALPGGAMPSDPVALHAGLWLIHDFLDESHALSQSIEGRGADRNGDYWHGIMHRREPDWSNSKYWFRRVGDHPIFFDLAVIAGQLLSASSLPDADRWSRQLGSSSNWDPFTFVDLCQVAARDASSELASLARRIQWAEILLLLAHCH